MWLQSPKLSTIEVIFALIFYLLFSCRYRVVTYPSVCELVPRRGLEYADTMVGMDALVGLGLSEGAEVIMNVGMM